MKFVQRDYPSPIWFEPKYIIIDRYGVIKRKLFINEDGKVFEEIEKEVMVESDDDNTIKLGLVSFDQKWLYEMVFMKIYMCCMMYAHKHFLQIYTLPPYYFVV